MGGVVSDPPPCNKSNAVEEQKMFQLDTFFFNFLRNSPKGGRSKIFPRGKVLKGSDIFLQKEKCLRRGRFFWGKDA